MKNIIEMEQIHGNNVVVVDKKNIGKIIPKCDGLVTNSPDVCLQIRAADCLPIFTQDLSKNCIGLVHAGWRGLESGVIENAIGLMVKEFQTEPKDLNVYVGPHICQKHYEVKSDVANKFKKYKSGIKIEKRKIFLDLAKIAELQLIKNGILEKNIKVDANCTFEDEDLFSYRRNKTEKRNLYLLHLVGVK